jgi:hypothetical protein
MSTNISSDARGIDSKGLFLAHLARPRERGQRNSVFL